MSLRTVIITGASSGLGAALARAYAIPGAVLGLSGRDAGRLEVVARQCRDQGAIVHTQCVDVMDSVAMAAWLDAFDRDHPIDLCIANAGISAGTGGGGETLAQATRIFDVNLHGVLNTLHPVMELMLARGKGQLCIISSIAGFRGLPTAPAYSASKGAVRLYGQGLRAWLAPKGIRLSVVCPGFIRTPMTDVNPFPMPFMMSADKAAAYIRKNLARNKAQIVFPWPLALLSCLQNLLPEAVLARIYRKIPAKPMQ